MIFTNCQTCDAHIICDYEAGDTPVGALEEIVCDKCKAKNYVERRTIFGHTYSEAEAMALPGFRKLEMLDGKSN